MACAECDKDAATGDYLCSDCRNLIQPCVHKDRRKALTDTPLPEEMQTVLELESREFVMPLCECCGSADQELIYGNFCLYCLYFEKFPNGPSDYALHKFVYDRGKVYGLCPQCSRKPVYYYNNRVCATCEYDNSLCKKCGEVPSLDHDIYCLDCRFWISGVHEDGKIVIYHGMQYRGNILACKVVDSDRLKGELKLALPPQFKKNTMFTTTERPGICEKCGATFINHWPIDHSEAKFYPEECAPCAGARVFPWGACILEWDQAKLDKPVESR
jgi:hypothetical protein